MTKKKKIFSLERKWSVLTVKPIDFALVQEACKDVPAHGVAVFVEQINRGFHFTFSASFTCETDEEDRLWMEDEAKWLSSVILKNAWEKQKECFFEKERPQCDMIF